MENVSRGKFVFTSVILLLAMYSIVLTFGLFRMQSKAEQLAVEQRTELIATQAKIGGVLAYLETYHGDDDNRGKDYARLKIIIAEHEQKLFLLQDTINQLYAVAEK